MVRACDLTYDKELKRGTNVMKWGEQDWHGVVVAVKDQSSDDSSDSDPDFDMPVAQILFRLLLFLQPV